KVSGHLVCPAEFVELGSVNANRIGIDRRTLQMASKGRDHTRVNTARQISADRHIRPQSLLDRIQHYLFEAIHQRAGVSTADLVRTDQEVQLPVGPFTYGEYAVVTLPLEQLQIMAGRQELHTLKTGYRPRHGRKRKNMVNTAQVRFRGHHA